MDRALAEFRSLAPIEMQDEYGGRRWRGVPGERWLAKAGHTGNLCVHLRLPDPMNMIKSNQERLLMSASVIKLHMYTHTCEQAHIYTFTTHIYVYKTKVFKGLRDGSISKVPVIQT